MKKSFLVIFSIFITLLTALIVFLLIIVAKTPQTPQTTQAQSVLQDTIIEDPVEQIQYLSVNEVLTNFEQYVNRKIVVGGHVIRRSGDKIIIGDISRTGAPKWADTVTVETDFKTNIVDFFVGGDNIIVSGSYSGMMYTKDKVEFFLMADEIKLLK